jgi:tetratricopeptide (TPR) repeat protein
MDMPIKKTVRILIALAMVFSTVIIIILSVGFYRLLKLSNSSPYLDFQHGVSMYRLGAYDSAENYFSKALDENPKSPELLYDLGNTLFKEKKYAGAVNAYSAAAVLDPKDPDIQSNLKLARAFLNKKADLKKYEMAEIKNFRMGVGVEGKKKSFWNIIGDIFRTFP